MNITLKIEGSVIQFQQVDGLKDGLYSAKLMSLDTRSGQQNRAMHLYFTMIAAKLNAAGLDMKQVIKADVPWSPETVKEIIWRGIQKPLTGKQSSANLNKDEFQQVQETVSRLLGEKFGIYCDFPSIENKGMK